MSEPVESLAKSVAGNPSEEDKKKQMAMEMLEDTDLPSNTTTFIDPNLWNVPVTKKSDTTHLSTFVAGITRDYIDMQLTDLELFESFISDFEGWDEAMLTMVESTTLKRFKNLLRSGGIYLGTFIRRTNVKVIWQGLQLQAFPGWPDDEMKTITSFNTQSDAYRRRQNLMYGGTQEPPRSATPTPPASTITPPRPTITLPGPAIVLPTIAAPPAAAATSTAAAP